MTVQQDDWNSVSLSLLKNPHDLHLWQSLIHCAESQEGLINKTLNHIAVQNLRKSYDAFLERHPFLLKYWIAYALWERQFNENDKAELVFLRALDFGGHDITLWISYLQFKIETLTNNVDQILLLFEAARSKIGYHYHSFEFYQLYLKFLNTYADEKNGFTRKSIFLLRIMLEIPLYNYSSAFDLIFELVSSPSVTIDDISSFMNATNLKALKKLTQNNKKLILEAIKRFLADAYIVNQAQSLELFAYERLIAGTSRNQNVASVSLDRLETWYNYLAFVECSFPYEYVVQIFERSLLSTGNHHSIVLMYANFCINKGKINKARNLIRRSLPMKARMASVDLIICLADIEIATGCILMAKDLICRYILVNSEVLYRIFEKLMQIEALVNPNDEEYLCTVEWDNVAFETGNRKNIVWSTRNKSLLCVINTPCCWVEFDFKTAGSSITHFHDDSVDVHRLSSVNMMRNES
ncbi:hypothetical protein METBIDRAFT_76069 [Metschnikowia bicuspidata var. bicuspidata NRRL YB-4993]|uniref:Uncharacterized protein n=1 Tax=Metschnikowia bicuspidata var. bicuspidata NRRL YB-4993 TaxID=869754 RepID=A0A1A0HG09_9ASCO|nr:hypothetical protein METBIDRAFT_76069 [Metschnikowia bicuspidata var. bicuspidata NRRL YB-4993]OBA22920.1 hypothetical protein METBIDRAFT_76069 [Metschnikowia bicuspidata var. bicuspidata NRRL YB-4993]